MPLFYEHHPEEEVANPEQIDAELADRYTKTEADTLTQEASANAEKQAQTYSDSGDAATLASANTYSDQASAICRLFRDATNPGDTYPDDAAFLEIDFHYQLDELGSVEQFSKF